MRNASETKEVKRLEKQARQRQRQRHDVIRMVMAEIPGRDWMLDLLESCHVFASSFSTDALQTAFHEGERNVGLRMLADIMQACPDNYTVMMRERNERDAADDRNRAASTESDYVDDPDDSDDTDGTGEANRVRYDS